MVKAITWLLCTYLTLKLVQYVFGGRSGFGDGEPTFRAKLLRGEPILFAVAIAISVPVALWSSWYLHRGYKHGFEHATDCYGRLRALNDLPDIRGKFDAYKVFQTVEGAEKVAGIAGQALEMTPVSVTKALADKMRVYTDRYAILSRQGDRHTIQDQAAVVQRCLTEPLINF